jgi:hypothetical protein
MCDLMRANRQVPFVTINRRMQLGDLKQARSTGQTRVTWCALFLKAYAIVATRMPELRRLYFSFPSAHLYEHPLNVASVSVARDYQGEQAVFFGQFRAPDQQGLPKIDKYVRRLQQSPIKSISLFRRVLSVSRMPSLLRRAIWWIGMNTSGRRSVKYFGTFGLSTTSGLGATLESMISPCPTNLTYGPIADDGSVEVRLIFDHRVLDGAPAAKALAELETVLTGEIVDELKSLPRSESTDLSDISRAA